jgi:hypothetical protein
MRKTPDISKGQGMKLAIFGSRSLKCEKTAQVIVRAIEKYNPSVIITAGETLGVCELARIIARITSVPLKLYWLNEKRCAGKYHWRSVGVLNECDFCLFIHDGKSKGTKNEIDVCKKMNKLFECILIKNEV